METNNITAALGLASFDANDNQFHADNLSLAGLPYVQDSGLYRATIVTARLGRFLRHARPALLQSGAPGPPVPDCLHDAAQPRRR